MSKLPVTLLLIFIYSFSSAQIKEENDPSFHHTVSNWFSAWELVYKEIYGLNDIEDVDFVLFDTHYVYSTSEISIAEGDFVHGADLLNLSLKWKKKAHHGVLTFPDGSSAPVGMMCFAAPNSINNKPYFVMPLTSFWNEQKIKSAPLALEDLVTGVFLHEFSHTQQMENFGRWISEFVDTNKMGDDFDDNFIQNTFQKDSVFVRLYNQEIDFFYGAISTKKNVDVEKVNMGLEYMKARRNLFFVDKFENLFEVEDHFLTMEGFGQYNMYLWLTHKKGGNIDKNTAVEGVRRNKRVWSQDQGFLLFLILEEFTDPVSWAKYMFGSDLIYIYDLLKQKIIE